MSLLIRQRSKAVISSAKEVSKAIERETTTGERD